MTKVLRISLTSFNMNKFSQHLTDAVTSNISFREEKLISDPVDFSDYADILGKIQFAGIVFINFLSV